MKNRILLVEDTRTIIMAEEMMLARYGFQTRVAKNGVEGLKMVAEDPPDLILLDVMMPEMDGIEMCRRIKEDPATRDIPVIMVTTQGEAKRVEEAFAAGCDDYVTKPIDRVELIEKMNKYLKGKSE